VNDPTADVLSREAVFCQKFVHSPTKVLSYDLRQAGGKNDPKTFSEISQSMASSVLE
jgi:hypothetical protein